MNPQTNVPEQDTPIERFRMTGEEALEQISDSCTKGACAASSSSIQMAIPSSNFRSSIGVVGGVLWLQCGLR